MELEGRWRQPYSPKQNRYYQEGKTMIVGYDVTRPTNLAPIAGKQLPSLAGRVASVDQSIGQ